MTARPTIDASASELDFAITEGNAISFNFLVAHAEAWDGATFEMTVREAYDTDIIVIIDVVATADIIHVPPGCDFLCTHAPVPELTNVFGKYVIDLKDMDAEITRYTGNLYVGPKVTD